eukprot:scaffold12665_cov107-Isochrysis_galbana.AAC.2
MDSEYQVLDAHHRVVEEEAAVTAGQQSRGRRRLLAGGVQARREHRQWHNVQGRNFLSYWQRRSKHGGLRSLRRRPDRLGCENWLRRWGCRCLAHRRREVCSAGCRCRIAGVAQLSERFAPGSSECGCNKETSPAVAAAGVSSASEAAAGATGGGAGGGSPVASSPASAAAELSRPSESCRGLEAQAAAPPRPASRGAEQPSTDGSAQHRPRVQLEPGSVHMISNLK